MTTDKGKTARNPRMPMTFDHLMSTKRPVTKRLRLANDQELAERYEAKKAEVAQLKQIRQAVGEDSVPSSDMDRAESELAELAKKVEEDSIVMVFQSIGRRAYDDLVSAYPVNDEVRKEIEKEGGDPKQVQWNPHTFPIALIAASCVEPKMTYEEVDSLQKSDQFNSMEIFAMFQTAEQVNTQRRVIDLGKD